MLETADLTMALDKDEYQTRLGYLRGHLFDLQKACWESGVGSVVVFEGWDAAGKGSTINALTSRLEPRGLRLHPIRAPRHYETQLPWLWRFWQKLPNYGEMAIFDQSWYWQILAEQSGRFAGTTVLRAACADVAEFEHTLADDGYVLVKFFLHISKQEQRDRLKKAAKDPLLNWEVGPDDWERHARYDELLVAIEEMLALTETEWAPWTIVEATDRRWARIRVFETLVQNFEAALRARGRAISPWKPGAPAEG